MKKRKSFLVEVQAVRIAEDSAWQGGEYRDYYSETPLTITRRVKAGCVPSRQERNNLPDCYDPNIYRDVIISPV